MGNLISFIIRHGAGIIFILLQVLCALLIIKESPYQKHVLLSSANRISGTIYNVANQITGYFYLRTENKALLKKNAELSMELQEMKKKLERASIDTVVVNLSDSYIAAYAEVINNSVSKVNNYITLDKGKADGIVEEMGVVNQDGIVGIVSVVSEHYSVAISLLNSKLRISCKVKGDNAIGSLTWKGHDPSYAVLEELPRHSTFHIGDTIVTSGYSAIFPEGITVGTIEEIDADIRDFNAVKIKLSTDFYRLRNVRVIGNRNQKEKTELEVKALKE